MKTPANELDVPPNNPQFDENFRPSNPLPEHHKIRLNKRQYCISCTENGRKALTLAGRETLGDISSNVSNVRRQRPPTTWTGCGAKACEDKAVCKAFRYWEELHRH